MKENGFQTAPTPAPSPANGTEKTFSEECLEKLVVFMENAAVTTSSGVFFNENADQLLITCCHKCK